MTTVDEGGRKGGAGAIVPSTAPSEEGVRALLSTARRLRSVADGLERQALYVASGTVASEPSWADVLHGDWGSIRTGALAALDGEEQGREEAAAAEVTVAMTSALLGDAASAREFSARADIRVDARGTLAVGRAMAQAVDWLGRGQPVVATELLLGLARDASPDELLLGSRRDLVGLLVDAAARSGRLDEIRPLLSTLSVPAESGCAGAGGAAGQELALALAVAATAPLEALEALVDSPHIRSVFGLGRLHLWAGMLHRRRRNVAAARHRLQVALDHLRRCGAVPWITIAANELRVAGVPDAHRGPLTEQQLAIARLAALGLSNRDIAQELYLSPRTVGSHLYRIFPKLGISSRHHLTPELVEGR